MATGNREWDEKRGGLRESGKTTEEEEGDFEFGVSLVKVDFGLFGVLFNICLFFIKRV